MKTELLLKPLLLLALMLFSTTVTAGDYERDVENLADSNLASGAAGRIAEAGEKAFDDLMDGLKLNPDEEGIEADEQASRSAIRIACARLLGELGDTRAAEELLRLLKEETGRPDLQASSANALGAIYEGKEDSARRTACIDEMARVAGIEGVSPLLLWGSLRGLTRLKAKGEVGEAHLASTEPMIQVVAIELVVVTGRKNNADTLVKIWTDQKAGEVTDYAEAPGVAAPRRSAVR